MTDETPLWWTLPIGQTDLDALNLDYHASPYLALLKPEPVPPPNRVFVDYERRSRWLDRWDVLSAGTVEVLSPRAVSVIAPLAGEDIELLDCQIRTKDVVVEDWKAMHVLTQIECMDPARSDVEWSKDNPGWIVSYRAVRFLAGCLGTHAVAWGRAPRVLLVSRAFAAAVEAAGLRGIRFREDHEYHSP